MFGFDTSIYHSLLKLQIDNISLNHHTRHPGHYTTIEILKEFRTAGFYAHRQCGIGKFIHEVVEKDPESFVIIQTPDDHSLSIDRTCGRSIEFIDHGYNKHRNYFDAEAPNHYGYDVSKVKYVLVSFATRLFEDVPENRENVYKYIADHFKSDVIVILAG